MMEKNTSYTEIQAKRLFQIYWAIQVTFIITCLQRLYYQAYLDTAVIIITSLLLIPVLTLTKKNKVPMAMNLLLSIGTLFCLYFIWAQGGVHDELILALPSILIFASMTGNKKLFVGLLIFISASMALNGLSNYLGWVNNVLKTTYLESTIIYLFILWLLAYVIWVLASDVQLLLDKQNKEHKKLLQSKAKIENLLNHDLLTTLPNRTMAEKRFEDALQTSLQENLKVCLLFIDIDNFKQINDGLGHKAGDELLKEIAHRLKSETKNSGVTCRLAGDEFLIIIPSVKDEDTIQRIAFSILNIVTLPFNYQAHELICSCSIGISISPDHGSDFSIMTQNADTAMYHSKSLGGNALHFYNEEMGKQGVDYLNNITELRKALVEEQFVLYYQPKIDLINQKVIGAEALIRWQHPEKGLVYPDSFIAQAEKSGLIVEIGDWVLRTSCVACKSWLTLGLDNLSIAVNVSSGQFKRSYFAQTVESALAESGLPAASLELEMTESLLIDNSDELEAAIKRLRELGVSFSIDDFGTGYSNLSYLKEFDIELLKIDRSFIYDIDHNPKNKALVTAIIQMAKALSLKVVGEGIENTDVANALAELGCDYGQGYYWSKPLSEHEFIDFVNAFEKTKLENN